MKTLAVALVFSLLTGCAGVGSYGNGSYQQRQIERKCQVSAQKNAQTAYIRKASTVKFASSQKEAYKAQETFAKRMDSIQKGYNNCLASGQRQVYEEKLRRQMTYNDGYIFNRY